MARTRSDPDPPRLGRVAEFLIARSLEFIMKAIVYSETGAPSVLHLVERTVPEPEAGEVRIRVIVSGVNPTDWKTRRGSKPGESVGFADVVPNQDGAGIIDAVGSGVRGFTVGDRVWTAIAAYQRARSGTAQEFTVLPADRVYPLPSAASFDLGAALGVPAMTAHRALTVAEDGPSRLSPGALSGAMVLVAGGAGAVGHAAIQLARWAGATVITTISSDEKAALARAAGANHVVNYRESDAAFEIRRLAPDGVAQGCKTSKSTLGKTKHPLARVTSQSINFSTESEKRVRPDLRSWFKTIRAVFGGFLRFAAISTMSRANSMG